MRSHWLVLAAFTLGVVTISAADWPQWRGPQRNGISGETGLLREWPKEGPPLLWHVKDAGAGYSTPAVVGEHLFLLSNEGLENESVQARKTSDGSLVWSTRIGKVGNPKQEPAYPGARSTPTIDGDLVFAFGSDGDIACLDKATGSVRWQKNVRNEFEGKPGRWAYAESPLIDGEVVICTPGGPKATLVALNKATGDVVWTSSVPGGDEAGYASAIVVDAGGLKQYVQFMSKGIVGVDAASGKFLWRYDGTGGSPANIPTPVADEGHVYSASGKGGAALVSLAISPGSIEAVEKYHTPKLPNAIGGAVKIGDYLYGTGSGSLMCVEFATGDVKWQARGVSTGSICFADGHLYLHGENGQVALVEATPEAYREKGLFTPPEQPKRSGQAWTYPVVANGRFYLRDAGTIWCYDVKKSD